MEYYKDEKTEKEIEKMKKILESKEFTEEYIRDLVAKQRGTLSIRSKYYDDNIAEGNWSLIEDADIEEFDKREVEKRLVDMFDVIYGVEELPVKKDDKYTREEDAEYSYIFVPSYYAVKSLILFYIFDRDEAKRVYSLKNAVVRHIENEYYGGLPFILRYIKELLKKESYHSLKSDFDEFIEMLNNNALNNNKTKEPIDEFIKDIIDCINKNLI